MAVRPDDEFQDGGTKAPDLVFLDFSKMAFKTNEELKNALWKIPDLRLRHDRLWDEEVLCKYSTRFKGYPFGDPVPTSLSTVRITDLSQVDIDWRMMTLLRPNTKVEEDIFTRLIELDKLRRQTIRELVPTNSRLLGAKPVRQPGQISSSARNKQQQVASDEDDDLKAPSQGTMSYQYYQREEELDPEDREMSELAASVAKTVIEHKKHHADGQHTSGDGQHSTGDSKKQRKKRTKNEKRGVDEGEGSGKRKPRHNSEGNRVSAKLADETRKNTNDKKRKRKETFSSSV